MKENNKVSLLDWRFKFGIFLLVLTFLLIVIALILLPTAKFTNRFDSYLGNGFWALNHYSLKDLLFNWTSLDDQAVVDAYLTHPFSQVFVALLFLLVLAPILIILGFALVVRWWIKTRI
ncbi:hypothetical protein [Spiroplasma platyhelix]|uniref:Uncharacterized protein n=1 Tax=Spiroplasma platyhelix PALS-1 TaxID=1276218 RepID=A0A846U4V0_9MOLU|nr:hypothetical protein [Spiroplasma platyhelix]MBE4704117.1 hypothetical protein [Spiroplasma platyhelix PALS-1]NKE38487.1 hypothetical protein [Spiroplasma platyhelix PALS-1]UJB29375.1 hypothetical protein SPLAT_v1c06110 [Spiroplasma platyhelix PALS-1]